MGLGFFIDVQLFSSIKSRRCYSTDNVSNSMSCWAQDPINAWAVLASSRMSRFCPDISITTVPFVGLIFPINTLSDVVFPAPLWPKKQKISSLYKFKFSLFTALKSPKLTVKSLKDTECLLVSTICGSGLLDLFFTSLGLSDKIESLSSVSSCGIFLYYYWSFFVKRWMMLLKMLRLFSTKKDKAIKNTRSRICCRY